MTACCIVCQLEFVEREKADRFSQLCGNCIQKAEREAAKQEPTPPIASPDDLLAALEQTFKKSFGQA
jgi:hypothetical protein